MPGMSHEPSAPSVPPPDARGSASGPARPGGRARGGALAGTAVALALASMALPEAPMRDEEAGARGVPAAIAAAATTPFSCGARLAPEAATDAGASAGAPAARLVALREALYARDRFARPSGDGERVECRGASGRDRPGDAPYPVTWRFDLHSPGRTFAPDGTVILDAFESRHTVDAPRGARLVDDAVVAETLSLPEAGAWRAAPDGGGLVATLSARRAGAGGCVSRAVGRCTVALDIGWRLRAVGDGLAIEQRFWVGGRAAERVVWRLRS